MTPDLWEDGLSMQIIDAVKRASDSEVAGAALSRRARTELALFTSARDRLPLSRPELN
jgi:hypothetical protein